MRYAPGQKTPALPCLQCRAPFPLEILGWSATRCTCRPECDKESAVAEVRCPNCGNRFTIYFADEPAVWMDEWSGGESPCAWHAQIDWKCQADSCWIGLDSDEPVAPENQWIADIGRSRSDKESER